MIRTYNFKLEPQDFENVYAVKGEYRDLRNGFICVDPTVDIECYLNYISLLNLNRDKWRSYGYLDLGMMPLVMGPSFMHEHLRNGLVSIMTKYGIPCYDMPPVSNMYASCKLPYDDVWMFKSDVAKVTGISEDKLTLERLIRWCGV